MGLFDNVKAFVHSITTDDHYALYDLPYRNSLDPEASRLNADCRLNSSSSASLAGNVGYTPGLRLNLALLLTVNLGEVPLQPMDTSGNVPLPSMDSLWDRIEAWTENEYPELDDALNLGVTTADLNEFEQDMRCGKLPEDFRIFYKRHDGQMHGGKPTGLFFGLPLLDLEGIAQETIVWKRVVDHLEDLAYKESLGLMGALNLSLSLPREGSSSKQSSSTSSNSFVTHQRSIPPNSIQPVYYHAGWLPFIKDGEGNQLAIDLAPGSAGQHGQVILFGRNYDTKLVVAPSLKRFIFDFVQDIDAGNYIIDSLEQAEASGYLLISRDDDYMVGDEDEGQGELSFRDCDGKEFPPKTFHESLTYLDVLRVRALKRYGLAQNYRTAFTPANPTRTRAPLKRTSAESKQVHQETLIETPRIPQKSPKPKATKSFTSADPDAKVATDSSEGVDETKKSGSESLTGSQQKSGAKEKSKTSKKAEKPVPAPADEKTGTEKKFKTSNKAEKPVPAPADEKTGAEKKSETSKKAAKPVPAPADEKTDAEEKSETSKESDEPVAASVEDKTSVEENSKETEEPVAASVEEKTDVQDESENSKDTETLTADIAEEKSENTSTETDQPTTSENTEADLESALEEIKID